MNSVQDQMTVPDSGSTVNKLSTTWAYTAPEKDKAPSL